MCDGRGGNSYALKKLVHGVFKMMVALEQLPSGMNLYTLRFSLNVPRSIFKRAWLTKLPPIPSLYTLNLLFYIGS